MKIEYLEEARQEKQVEMDGLQSVKDENIAKIEAEFENAVAEIKIEIKCIDNLIAKAPVEEVEEVEAMPEVSAEPLQ